VKKLPFFAAQGCFPRLSGIVVIQQHLETAFLITFEIVTGSLLIKEKNSRYLSRRAAITALSFRR
jgi:hypothetical protein